MSNMLFNYDPPDYTVGDDDYNECRNLDEVRALRLTKTYADFVRQRYRGDVEFNFRNFRPDKNGKSFRTTPLYKNLRTYVLDKLPEGKEAYFIAFVFESWDKRRNNIGKLERKGLNTAGIAYPSWKYIIDNHAELIQNFLNNKNYAPKEFIPKDDFIANYSEAIEARMLRWCDKYGKTPKEYWLTGKNLFPPFLSSKEFPYACKHKDGLETYAKDIKKQFDITLEELKEFIEALEEAEREQIDAQLKR